MPNTEETLTTLHRDRRTKIVGVASYGIVVSIVTIVALTLGVTYNWPDFVHVNYGFPFVWGTHTLSTISGPSDNWSVDVSLLVIDLSIWLSVLLIGAVALAGYSGDRNKRLK